MLVGIGVPGQCRGKRLAIGRIPDAFRRLGAGSVHKAGIVAAAGLLALELVGRVTDDHRRARDLAAALDLPEPATNIVLTELPASALPELAARGVLAMAPDGERVRLVTHAGVSDEDVAAAAAALR